LDEERGGGWDVMSVGFVGRVEGFAVVCKFWVEVDCGRVVDEETCCGWVRGWTLVGDVLEVVCGLGGSGWVRLIDCGGWVEGLKARACP
jgi:hypothetical protein